MQDDLFASPPRPEPAPSAPPSVEAARIAYLRSELTRHDRLYYNDARPEISDAEYDTLFRELEQLERNFPQFDDPNSPTKRVGGTPLTAFQQVAHLLPMLSIDDIFEQRSESETAPQSDAELLVFYQRLQKNLGHDDVEVTIEPKIDGVAVTLIYRDGKLDLAATRGDGQTGDDVTENVRTIRSIPRILPVGAPPLLEVRGEIFMPNSGFAKLNESLIEAGLQPFVNPRNAAAGTLKQLDSKIVATRPLAFLAHGLGAHSGIAFPTESDFFTLLDQLGIPRNSPIIHADNLEATRRAVAHISALRHQLDYGTDGAVIKVFKRAERESLGFTSRAPRWAAAFKFLPEQKESVLRAITIQVGRTGVLTPVAELDPVFISGSTVARATLHNEEEIQRKDIRIGDTVVLEKAGEIIPAVVRVVKEKRPENTSAFSLPDFLQGQCPSCAGPISRNEGFVAWRCTNFLCPAQAVTRIGHFCSRKALEIESIGITVAEALVRDNLVHSPLDLFSLTVDQLGNLNLGSADEPRRFGEKNASKAIDALDRARHKPMSRWLFALGIPQVGENAAKELTRLHRDFDALAHSPLTPLLVDSKSDDKKKNPELAKHQISSEFGPAVAKSLTEFFDSTAGKTLLARMQALGINPVSDNYAPFPDQMPLGPLSGKVFVLTGALSQPREVIQEWIESQGGKVSNSVSKKTSYVVAGEGGGSKSDKAMALGVPIIDEATLRSLVVPE